MTNQPARDARPSTLHRRLTVAFANASDRARLAELVADGLGAIEPGERSPLLRSEDLWLAADGFARERAVKRNAVRSQLDAGVARTMHDCDTASHQLDHLTGWARTLREGADWATGLHETLPGHLAAVEAVRDALDARRAEQRAAQQDLERVLEQRSAAAAAIEEANSELAELADSGMDESGLRRELEAAGQAARTAQEVQAAALAQLESLQIEATGLQVRREAVQPAACAAGEVDHEELAATIAVRDALSTFQSVMIEGEVDREAQALATAWADLHADLEVLGATQPRPSEAELDAARARLEAATTALDEIKAAASAGAMTPEQRAELDAAHAEVLEAEESSGGRFGGGAARRRLEQAQAAERTLLDQLGFDGYLDVVLSGGRAGGADPARSLAERERFDADLALQALERAAQTDPRLDHLRAERSRLLDHVTDHLGIEPGEDVIGLLRAHRPVARALRQPLVDALAAVGVHPVGVSLDEAATAYLKAHPLPEVEDEQEDDDPAGRTSDERRAELAAIEARWAELEGELQQAEAEVDRSAEALQMAERSVGAFEGELTVRAGEDAQRLGRFAAAEQLRSQIEAVAGTLRRADEGAREAVDAAGQAVAAAESTFEQTATEIGDLARRARKLAEELPIDGRPEGDPLRTLLELAEALRAHAEFIRPEIDQAEAFVASVSVQLEEALAARRAAGDGDEGPRGEDFVDGLEQLLEEPSDALLILDEPFVGIDAAVRAQLLEAARACSSTRQILLLTEDAEVLGWAIELPVEEAAAVPADTLLAKMRRADTDVRRAAPPAAIPVPAAVAASAGAVDITSPVNDPEPAPAPTARRWAGQR